MHITARCTIHPRRLCGALLLLIGAGTGSAQAAAAPASVPPPVVANDNRHPAGRLEGGVLTLDLRAARGTWRPEGERGPALTIDAFGEAGAAPVVPAPLIRVPEGTTVAATVANTLDTPLIVRGLCSHDDASCAPLTVPPGESRAVRFVAARAGTYHYWATSLPVPLPIRELAGAFVVDAPGAPVDDRVMVITEWSSLTTAQLLSVITADDPNATFVALRPGIGFMLNGQSWPHTERLTYAVGAPVRWRVVNVTSQAHPMHLHGFYFTVERSGDGVVDTAVPAGARHPVVTHLLPPRGTITLTWTPERIGNWLFHCHVMNHVSPERRLPRPASPHETHGEAVDTQAPHAHGGHQGGHDGDDADGSRGMAGLVLGITVTPAAADAASTHPSPAAPRRLTLELTGAGDATGDRFGVRLDGDGVTSGAAASSPGPTLVLMRGEPVEITVVNRLAEATALHWHGLELDSYYDGVHGWSGAGPRVAPMIAPGASFVVRLTPPRAGTFIYHTHVHDQRQLPLGLYGALVVVEPGERFDPATDHVVVVGREGLDPAAPDVILPATPVVINGSRTPLLAWQAGTTHRVRLINITPDDILTVGLRSGDVPVEWTPVAKDGAALPPSARVARPSVQTVAVGETYDFTIALPAPGRLWLEVRTPAGHWEAQGQVVVK